jgi:hypothetical protein
MFPRQSVVEKIGKSPPRFVPCNGMADGSAVGHRTLIKQDWSRMDTGVELKRAVASTLQMDCIRGEVGA